MQFLIRDFPDAEVDTNRFYWPDLLCHLIESVKVEGLRRKSVGSFRLLQARPYGLIKQ